MLGTDRDALICDLAETYHLYSLDAVPVMTLAALCAGLHSDSRIKLGMLGYTRIDPAFALVNIADTLTMFTHSGDNPPELLRDIMTGKHKQDDKLKGFGTFEAFEAARKRILGHE